MQTVCCLAKPGLKSSLAVSRCVIVFPSDLDIYRLNDNVTYISADGSPLAKITSMSWYLLLAMLLAPGATASGFRVKEEDDSRRGWTACPSGPHVVVKRSFAGQECSAHHLKRALSLREEQKIVEPLVFHSNLLLVYKNFKNNLEK